MTGRAGDPDGSDAAGAGGNGADATGAGAIGAGARGADGLEVDWAALRAAADEAGRASHAPYSGFRVGAAALVDDGRVVTGCNVENASYGLTLCAECGLVSSLHATGGGRLVAFACRHVDGGRLLMPCGRCRQLLWEAGGPELLVDTPDGPRPMTEVLPFAFGADELPSPPGAGAP